MNTSRILFLVVAVLVPCLSEGAPVQVSLSGEWFFADPITDVPEFAAAMGSTGVNNGSPLTVALTFDDSAVSDGSGVYTSGLLAGTLSLGTQSYSIGGGAVQVAPDFLNFFVPFAGPLVSAGGHSFAPNFVQFDTRGGIPSGDLFAAVSNASLWASSAIISFNVPGTPFGVGPGFRGVSALQVTSVSVPEPSSLLLGGSLLFLLALARSTK